MRFTAFPAKVTWREPMITPRPRMDGVHTFWSGDSMLPEGQVRGDVTRRQARLRRFLESARNIAAGGPGRLPAETA